MTKILNLFRTLYSLIVIYHKLKDLPYSKKVLMFYFPVRIYQENITELIGSLKEKNKFSILVYNSASATEIKKKTNSFFLDLTLLKFIPFKNFFLKRVNYFFSSYLSYIYPPNSKNIYISHDIYDAPMVNLAIEKKIFLQIKKLDYIFLSSQISKNYFISKFKKYKIKIFPELINTGYLKLDHIWKKVKRSKFSRKKKHILIAPCSSFVNKKYNMTIDLEKIIFLLLNDLNQKVVYRPHPFDLTTKGNLHFIKRLIQVFSKNSNFYMDSSVSYLNSFKNSKFLITDLSSTAYTYAFATEKPVIFYSPDEKLLKKNKFLSFYYFIDRNKIGITLTKFNQIKKKLIYFQKQKLIYKKRIISLRNQRIKYFNKSLMRTKKIINYL